MKHKSPPYFSHKTAVIDPEARIGRGVQIWHFSHVMPGAEIGEGAKLGQNVFIDREVRIGRNVKIQNNVSVYRGVTLADDVFVGPSVVFTNVIRPRSRFPKKVEEYAQTHVGEGATLGANATILSGIRIGDHAFVGAGTVVTKEVPPFALMMGVPARQRGWVCVCGEALAQNNSRKKASCRRCGQSFLITKTQCRIL